MKSSRLLAILILLQLRKRLTAVDLAREFEVSMRTIYRDIDALSAAGVPVYGDRGPGGGFQLLDGYRTQLTGLDQDEAEAMLMIGLPGPAAQLGLGNATVRAKGKLLASLPAQSLASADRIAERFHFDPVDWYRAAEDAPFLPLMARAVLDQCQVALTYESWNAKRSWTVDPLGMVMKGGAWYAVVRAGEKIMTFRVAGIYAAQTLDVSFYPPPDFSLGAWWQSAQARFEAELRPNTAHLRLSADAAKRLAVHGAYAAKAVAEAELNRGSLDVQLPYENEDQGAALILSLGEGAEVISPNALRKRIQSMAIAAANRHKEPA